MTNENEILIAGCVAKWNDCRRDLRDIGIPFISSYNEAVNFISKLRRIADDMEFAFKLYKTNTPKK